MPFSQEIRNCRGKHDCDQYWCNGDGKLALSRGVPDSSTTVSSALLSAGGVAAIVGAWKSSSCIRLLGVRGTLIATNLARTVITLMIVVFPAYSVFLIVVVIGQAIGQWMRPAAKLFLSVALPPNDRMELLAKMSAWRNSGYVVGALVATGFLALPREYLHYALVVDAVAFLVAGIIACFYNEVALNVGSGRTNLRHSFSASFLFLRPGNIFRFAIGTTISFFEVSLVAVGVPAVATRIHVLGFVDVAFMIIARMIVTVQVRVTSIFKSRGNQYLGILTASFLIASIAGYVIASRTERWLGVSLLACAVVLNTFAEMTYFRRDWKFLDHISQELSPELISSWFAVMSLQLVIGETVIAMAVHGGAAAFVLIALIVFADFRVVPSMANRKAIL